uniref:Uncharacterized protein TCIL3000_7_700 n=1 Tax=Trypanosoma congolense (strain IL3000) TaxID=1068625 RepID=G0UPF9_TRYCI|nr:unnamed protein product [Trypanosoma congolense IL3000]
MEAEHQGVQSSVKCTTVAVYQPNPLSLYSISWCFSVARLHITCAWERLLNSLWRVKSKLVLFDGRSLIPTYELSLRRLLAAGCEIENTWIMSRKASGAFKTVVGQLTPQGVQRGLQLLVGYRTLNISLFSTTPTVWGDGEATRGKSSRGLLEHSVSVDPLRGVAQVGFSAWYFCSKWNRVGVGFSTVLPCSYGIMKYASLFVDRPDYLSINELLLLFARGDHIIRVPIVVFQSPQVQLALMWLTAPVLLYRIARFIMRPYQSFRTAALYRQNRLLHRAEMDVARASAQHEQQALQNSALRSRMAEESIGGLIIVNAKYGVLYPRYPEAMVLNLNHGNGTTAVKRAHIAGSLVEVWRKFWRACTARTVSSDTSRVDGRGEKKTEGDEESETCFSVLVLDVTVPLQCLVRDSQLTLPEGPKDKIVGFTDTDPFTDERKHLKIVYRFQHRRHMVVVSDGEAVRLPQREHLMDV